MAASVLPVLAGLPRVNLMPRSEVVRRQRDKLVRRWVWIVFGAIVVALLIIAGSYWMKLLADQRLLAEQAETTVLLTEIASLSNVSQALATEAELTDFRAEAMASDLAWTPVLAKVTGILPPDTILTGFALTVGGATQDAEPAEEQGLVGTISIDSPTPLDIAAIIRSLRGVDGVLYADGRSVTSSQSADGRFAYVLDAEFDQTIYSGDYAVDAEGEN